MSETPSRPITGSNKRPGQSLAVIVGAGGMGMAVARRLGQGHRLVLIDVNQQRLDEEGVNLKAEGYDVSGFACDITSFEKMAEVAAQVSRIAQIGVLAHVAGLSPSMADWATIMQVNLLGARNVEAGFFPYATNGTAAIF